MALVANDSGGDRGWDVFLAHASADKPRARVLKAALEAAGVSVCFDEAALRPGDNWFRLLPRYQELCPVTVALISTHTDAAHYEISELIEAINGVRWDDKRLIPVAIDEESAGRSTTYGLGQIQAGRWVDDSELGPVVAAIADVVRNPHLVPPQRQARRIFSPQVPVVPEVFEGRDEYLAQLAVVSAAPGSTAVVTQSISGMGGVGKTLLAAAFAEQHRNEFDIVWWARCDDQASLVGDLAGLAEILQLRGDNPEDRAARVRPFLETTERRWLLVLDNVDNEELIDSFRARRGNGTVLITTRSKDVQALGAPVEVGTFAPEVSERFLQRRVPARSEEDLSGVIERLDGLPIALEQAAAWTARHGNRTFAKWCRKFDEAIAGVFDDKTRPKDYDATALTTWTVSMDAAADEAPLARPLMHALAFVAPVGLPVWWLLDSSTDAYLGESDPAEVERALEALDLHSLIELTDDDTVEIHRVMQAAARSEAPPDAPTFVAQLLRSRCPGAAWEHTAWPSLQAVQPHVTALDAVWVPTLEPDAAALWWVLDDIGTYLGASGQLAAALETHDRALVLAVEVLGADHPDTLGSRHNLAYAYRAAGRVEEAITAYEEVFADRLRVLGADRPDTLGSRNNLAGAYRAAGRVEEAITAHEEVLADRLRVLGADRPDTLGSRNNLAYAYQAAGRIEEAIKIWGELVEDCRRLLPPSHEIRRTVEANRDGAVRQLRSAGET